MNAPQKHGDRCGYCGRKFHVPAGSLPIYGPICKVCLASSEREHAHFPAQPTISRHFPQPSDVRPAEHPGSWTDVRYFPQAEQLWQDMCEAPDWDWATVMAGVHCTDHGRAWPTNFTPHR